MSYKNTLCKHLFSFLVLLAAICPLNAQRVVTNINPTSLVTDSTITSGPATITAGGQLTIPIYSGGSSGVISWNTRTGAVTLTAADVNALSGLNFANAVTFSGAVTFGSSSSITGTIQQRHGSGAYGSVLAAGEGYEDTTNNLYYQGNGTTNTLIGGGHFTGDTTTVLNSQVTTTSSALSGGIVFDLIQGSDGAAVVGFYTTQGGDPAELLIYNVPDSNPPTGTPATSPAIALGAGLQGALPISQYAGGWANFTLRPYAIQHIAYTGGATASFSIASNATQNILVFANGSTSSTTTAVTLPAGGFDGQTLDISYLTASTAVTYAGASQIGGITAAVIGSKQRFIWDGAFTEWR